MNTGIFYREQSKRPKHAELPPDVVLANTEVVDITEDYLWMEQARGVIAHAYSELANPKYGMTLEDIIPVVSNDYYELNGQARTFAALMTYADSGAKIIVGLGRVVVGRVTNEITPHPPIDAMAFIEPLDGWPKPAIGAPPVVAEFGRFMIVAECRTPMARETGLHAKIGKFIYDRVTDVVRHHSAKTLYAIMPPYMVRVVRQAGVRITEIPSRLRTEDPEAAMVFDRFSLYWQHAHPKLYEFPDAPLPAHRVSNLEAVETNSEGK